MLTGGVISSKETNLSITPGVKNVPTDSECRKLNLLIWRTQRCTSFNGKNCAGGELAPPCKHHTYTVFEAMLRISSVT